MSEEITPMTEELKPLPCPFCGGSDLVYGRGTASFGCKSCRAWGPAEREPDSCNLWNTRSPAWRDDMSEAPKDQRTIEAWHRQHQCAISIFWMPDDKAVTQMGRVLNWHEKTLTHAWPEEAFSHWRLPLPPEEKA